MACIGMLVDLCGASQGGWGHMLTLGFLNGEMKGLKHEILIRCKKNVTVLFIKKKKE